MERSEYEIYVARGQQGCWGTRPSESKERILTHHVIGKTVLDVGCATGMYTELLQRKGYSVVGVDPVAELLPTDGRATYRVGDLEAGTLPDGQFDTVISFDVLEHMIDDMGALAHLLSKASRRLIIRVPLSEPSHMPEAGVIFYHHVDKTHKRTYTVESFQHLLLEASNGTARTRAIVPDGSVDIMGVLFDSFPYSLPRSVQVLLRLLLRLAGLRRIFSDCFFVIDVSSDVTTD
jgi:SAM-dependent methyltransferase